MNVIERLGALAEQVGEPTDFRVRIGWDALGARHVPIVNQRPGMQTIVVCQVSPTDDALHSVRAEYIAAALNTLPDLLRLAQAAKARRDSGWTHSAECICDACEAERAALESLCVEDPS